VDIFGVVACQELSSRPLHGVVQGGLLKQTMGGAGEELLVEVRAWQRRLLHGVVQGGPLCVVQGGHLTVVVVDQGGHLTVVVVD